MDIRAGWEGIEKDAEILLDEPVPGVAFLLTAALPVVSVALVARRRWLGVVPLVLSLGVFATWFLYYATDWWSNPGQGAWAPALLAVLVGWAVAAVALWRAR